MAQEEYKTPGDMAGEIPDGSSVIDGPLLVEDEALKKSLSAQFPEGITLKEVLRFLELINSPALRTYLGISPERVDHLKNLARAVFRGEYGKNKRGDEDDPKN